MLYGYASSNPLFKFLEVKSMSVGTQVVPYGRHARYLEECAQWSRGCHLPSLELLEARGNSLWTRNMSQESATHYPFSD